jgi:hypothetical protein
MDTRVPTLAQRTRLWQLNININVNIEQHNMKPKFLLALLAAGLTSCAVDAPYHPANRAEKIEYRNDRPDVYPADVRKDLPYFSKVGVAWAGIIVTNNATDEDYTGKILMETLFQNRYYDWTQDDKACGAYLMVSPRGEGKFRMRWELNRIVQDANAIDALKYAAPGKLALVYGTPESVDPDGTIVLRYHYIRIFDTDHFAANVLDYGRIGESFRPYDAGQ